MRRIGILGGTFDPIHNGHIKLAENAFSQFPMDELWFMPAPMPPHKTGRSITDYRHRVCMVRLAIMGHAGFSCSEFESGREEKSYTAETLKELAKIYPDTAFSFILGADSFYEIESWYRPDIIFKIADLIVEDRDYDKNKGSLEKQASVLKEKYKARVGFIRAEEVDISSAHLRKMLADGKKSAEKFLPKPVVDYIKENHLYYGQS